VEGAALAVEDTVVQHRREHFPLERELRLPPGGAGRRHGSTGRGCVGTGTRFGVDAAGHT